MLFEHSLPRAPYERLRHSFRAQQKLVDREAGAVAAAASDLAKRAYDPADALSTVDGMIARIEALKAKVSRVCRATWPFVLTLCCVSLQHTMRRRRDRLSRFSEPG